MKAGLRYDRDLRDFVDRLKHNNVPRYVIRRGTAVYKEAKREDNDALFKHSLKAIVAIYLAL